MKKSTMSIKLNGGYVSLPIDDVGTYNKNINRGVGVHKPKKGKGSYSRKNKYKSLYL